MKDQFRIGVDQTALEFIVNTTVELLCRVKKKNMFVAQSNAIASAAKPDKLTKHSICAYKTLVRENGQRGNSNILRRISMVRYWILQRKPLPVQFKQALWSIS